MRSQLTNHQVGIVLDLQAWSEKHIRRPDMVERIGSYLGTSFPLFHAVWCGGMVKKKREWVMGLTVNCQVKISTSPLRPEQRRSCRGGTSSRQLGPVRRGRGGSYCPESGAGLQQQQQTPSLLNTATPTLSSQCNT